jgi:hypothetical protein
MKQIAILVVTLACSVGNTIADTNTATVKPGDPLTKHIQSLKAFGDGKPLLATPTGVPGETEVMMWRVGDGVLTVTTSIGAVIIKEMTYIVRGDGGKSVPLKVKEFNPKTGEMTIIVPNKASEATSEPAPGAASSSPQG